MSKFTPNTSILDSLGNAVYCLDTPWLCKERGEFIRLYTNKVHLRGLHTRLAPVAPPGNAHLEAPPPVLNMLCKTGDRINEFVFTQTKRMNSPLHKQSPPAWTSYKTRSGGSASRAQYAMQGRRSHFRSKFRIITYNH